MSPQRTSLLVSTLVEFVALFAECTVLQNVSQMASDADRPLIATMAFGNGNGKVGWRGYM